jgi:hypothetical protein
VAKFFSDLFPVCSVRFGFAFLIGSLGVLVGPPICGALLGDTFPWYKPIAFSAVSVLVRPHFLALTARSDSHGCGTFIADPSPFNDGDTERRAAYIKEERKGFSTLSR